MEFKAMALDKMMKREVDRGRGSREEHGPIKYM